MKQLLTIAMVAVLILSFAVSAVTAKPSRTSCDYVTICNDYACQVWLCCMVPGEGEVCILVS